MVIIDFCACKFESAKRVSAKSKKEHGREPVGVLQTAKKLRRNHDISYALTYRIMKDNGLVTASPAKSKKRKWVRFERRYSNAMWHSMQPFRMG